MSQFVDSFWGVSDITAGFQVLSSYMRRGRKECEDTIEYLKERIAIEEEYSKKLLKLGKGTDNKSGFGVEVGEDELNSTLRAAWKQVRESTEKLALKHKQFSEEIHTQIYQPLVNTKESQRKMVADTTEKVEFAQKEFSKMRATVPNLKKAYESKCKELDLAEQEQQAAQSQVPKKDKEITKIQQKIAKLQKDIEATDAAYKQGVEKLEETRIKWEEEMSNCCALFEGLEVNRISKMKESLNEFNKSEQKIHSSIITEAIEPCKVYVECIKPEIDLELFITEKRTGYGRPGPTFYENYYTGQMKDAVFGVDLEAQLANSDRKIPEIVELCVTRIEKSGIADEGIYRLSGRQSRVQQLKSTFDKNRAAVNLNDPELHNNDIASLLKLYLRELPKPIFTFSHYEQFIQASKIEDPNERLQKLRSLIHALPEVNRATLAYLMKHLKKVSEHEATNKMGIPNLAIVFAPGMIRSENEMNALKDFRHQSKLLEEIVRNHEALFS